MMPERLLRTYAKEVMGSDSIENIKSALEDLYNTRKLNPHEIVRVIFNVVGHRISTHSIRYWIRKVGIQLRSINERPKLLEKSVESIGFASIQQYFLSRPGYSFVEMSDELDVSVACVQRAYYEYLSDGN